MIEKLECTCIEAYTARKMREPNCCACSCDHNDLVEQLAKANERVMELDEIADTAFKYNHSSAECIRAWNKLQQLRKEQNQC